MIHTYNKAEAEFLGSEINAKFGFPIKYSQVAYSTVVLNNVPADINVETVRKAFGKHSVKNVRVIGKPTVSFSVPSAREALLATKAVEGIQLGAAASTEGAVFVPTSKLSVSVNPLPGDKAKHVVSVTDFPTDSNLKNLEKMIEEAVSKAISSPVLVSSDLSVPAAASVVLRFSPSLSQAGQREIVDKLGALTSGEFKGVKFAGATSSLQRIPKPCLLFRKVVFFQYDRQIEITSR
jgi:hypothetical protein